MMKPILFVAMAGMLALGAFASPEDAIKPVMVNLQIEFGSPDDWPGLDAILGAVEAHEWNATVYVTGECAMALPEVIKDIDERGHQLGVLEINVTKDPFDKQLSDIQKDFKAVLDAVGADRPEYVGEFRCDFQNVDTFKALEELDVRTTTGLQISGGISRPFHTQYGFISIPLSSFVEEGGSLPVALSDKEVLVRLEKTADAWHALLKDKFDQCLLTHEPMVVAVGSSLTGRNASYLNVLVDFLDYISKNNGFVALTDDVKSLANPYIENMTVTGPRTGTPGQTVTLTVTYKSTCWCPHYYFKTYGRIKGEWWNDWLGDLTGWTELNAQVFYPYYGMHSFSVPVTLPCANGTYLIRIGGRGAHSMYNAWPTAYIYEAIAHWSVDVTSAAGPIEVAVKNGLSFFDHEPREEKIPHPVFARGAQGPQFEVRGGTPESATVDITDALGRQAATVSIPISGSGPWTADWNWSSDLWMDVGAIPAGLYTATFHVESACAGIPEPKSFYVIFNPDSGPARFAFDETAIWFGASEKFDGTWWRGEDAGITYALHPDDNRVFSKAMSAVSGKTNVAEAANSLFDLETGLFGYELTQQANDVLALLKKSKAQCADDAAMLCAFCRAVGIPAHPVTADANLGKANWTFDTWVEALTGAEWSVYHPHEEWGPASRTDAADQAVAGKPNNDVVIMAGPNWLPGDVISYDRDAAFRFFVYGANNEMVPAPQGEGRPLPGFDTFQPWLVELSEAYWGVPHEDPPGPAENPIVTLEFDQLNYVAGQTVTATITMVNSSATAVSGTLDFSLVADEWKSMLWPDYTLMVQQTAVTIEAGATVSRTYTYVLPGNADATLLYQGIALWNGARASRTFEVFPIFATSVDSPASVVQFEPFILSLTVSNPGSAPIRQVSCSLTPSYELEVTAEPGPATVDLSPGGSFIFQWVMTGWAVSEVAQVEIVIDSTDGGSSRLTQRIAVAPGSTRPDIAVDENDVLLLPGIPRANALQDFVATVHNYGAEPCSAIVVFAIGGVQVGSANVSLEPGASTDLQFSTVLASGTHMITIEVDPEDAVGESDETNNLWTREFRVGLADFTVQVDSLLPSEPVPGAPLKIYASVFNRGSQPDQHLLDVQLVADGQSIWSRTIDLWSLGYEAPLYTWPFNFTITVPGGLSRLVLVADPQNMFEEWDETNNEAEIYVTPSDTVPPVISLEVTPSVIWPPNHQYVLVTPTVQATDNQDPNPVVCLDSVTIVEDAKVGTYDPAEQKVLGAGHTENDVILTNGLIRVRAERAGTGSGRRYVVTYRATDASGNTATASAKVLVPHDLEE